MEKAGKIGGGGGGGGAGGVGNEHKNGFVQTFDCRRRIGWRVPELTPIRLGLRPRRIWAWG